VVEWRDTSGSTDTALLLDISSAGNSAQACHLVDEFVERLSSEAPSGVLVDMNAGELLLTRGVLTKIKQQIQRTGANLGILYSVVPQTQQAALDEGLFVKEKLSANGFPIRQPLPKETTPGIAEKASRPEAPSMQKTSSKAKTPATRVDLPDFSQSKSSTAKPADFVPVAPQSLEIPELAEPEVISMEETFIEIEEEVGLEEILDALDEPQEIVYADNAMETLYLRQTLRSGKTIRFNGNIIIIGDVHAGSEITAGGDIIVWGELRGLAHAGAQGNYKAEIRAMKIEALQLRIADYIARRPDRIYYHKDGVEQPISPEVARVADGEIKIFKTALSRN
jgi:septum formation inhibitor MinC